MQTKFKISYIKNFKKFRTFFTFFYPKSVSPEKFAKLDVTTNSALKTK